MVYLGEYAAFMIYLVTTRRMSSAGAIMIGTSKDRVLGLRKVGPIAPKQKNWIDFELKSISLTLLRMKKSAVCFSISLTYGTLLHKQKVNQKYSRGSWPTKRRTAARPHFDSSRRNAPSPLARRASDAMDAHEREPPAPPQLPASDPVLTECRDCPTPLLDSP